MVFVDWAAYLRSEVPRVLCAPYAVDFLGAVPADDMIFFNSMGRQVHVYALCIRCGDGRSVTVYRRYSQFRHLAKLASLETNLPPKGFWRRLSNSFLREREGGLSRLLTEALDGDPCIGSAALRDFLGIASEHLSAVFP
jgi:hypothetical protein